MAGNNFVKWLAKDSVLADSGEESEFKQLRKTTIEYLSSYDIKYDDKIHKHMVVMYPKNLASRMIISSLLMTINLLTALYLGLNDFSIVVFIVFICSLNHWRFPILGMRRSMDLFSAQIAMGYHLYVAYYELNLFESKIYLYFGGLGSLLFYIIVLYFSINGYPNYASMFHSLWHIFGIFINTYLYFCVSKQRN